MPSSVKLPSSIRSASRSRAVSFSCSCWRSMRSAPPPSLACSRRSCRSSTSERSGGRATRASGAALSVVDMCLFRDGVQQRLEQLHRDRGRLVALVRILRELEGGQLEAHKIALLDHGFEKVVELLG